MEKIKDSAERLAHRKPWVVAVDMGYGHQRAAYPLRAIAHTGQVVNANTYVGITAAERKVWREQREFYEFISRFKNAPVVGEAAFKLFDYFQRIARFYPRRDLSHPTAQVRQTFRLIRRGWCEPLVKKLDASPRPLISTFFVPALAAEHHGYRGDIYLVICDADCSRAWVALNPRASRIRYLAPSRRVVERLKLYGVPPERIFFTGFPLPEENLGPNLSTLKHDLGRRLANLDSRWIYHRQYRDLLVHHLGRENVVKKVDRPLTVTFAVGGAAAQRELGVQVMRGLAELLQAGKVRLNLIAGVHNEVNRYFRRAVRRLNLTAAAKAGMIQTVFASSKQRYFSRFNRCLRTTDVLWTKPSELSFYCALGLPIIVAPSIGSQEDFNRAWLEAIGAGVNQEDPDHVGQWLLDWVKTGWLAEAAVRGFLEPQKCGPRRVAEVLAGTYPNVRQMELERTSLL